MPNHKLSKKNGYLKDTVGSSVEYGVANKT